MMQDNLAFIYPADFDKSERHRLASRIFKGLTKEDGDLDRCQCCNRRVGETGNSKNCWYSPIYDLVFLGPGVPLLFVFIQNAMLSLVLLAALFFFYSLITNILGNSCELNTKCILDVFNELSISNKINDNQSLMIQTYLVAAFIVVYMVFSQYMIFRVRQRDDKCDEVINSPSDYSIIIKNLPEDVEKRHIEEMIGLVRAQLDFDMKAATKNLLVKKIIISYALQEYLKEKKEQEEEFLKLKKEDQQATYVRKPIPKPTTTASFAIVVFDEQISKEAFFESDAVQNSCRYIMADCCLDLKHFEVNGKQVLVERAPEPDDILWENADIPKWRQNRNVFLAYFFGIIILAGGGAIQYLLQYYQNRISDAQIRSYYSSGTSLIVTIFNGIIIQFLVFVTKMEGRETKTDQDRSLLVKICLYSFFNAGIFYPLATILANSLGSFNIQGSFSYEITLFMAMNAISPNLISLLTTKLQFPTVIFRFLARLSCCKKTQEEANKLYELGTVDFPVKYAYVIRTVWLTCFYAPFVPLVVPISIFGLIIFYFTEAELFRSSYRAPNMLSISITRTAMRLLDFTGVLLAGGQILVVFYLKFIFGGVFTFPEQIGVALCAGLSIFLILIPSQKLNRKFFPIDDNNDNPLDYDDALKEFEVTYEGTNPLSDPKQRVRRNELNLFRFMGVADLLQTREFRSATKSTSSPLNILQQHEFPNQPAQPVFAPPQFNQNQFQQETSFNQSNQYYNQPNQYGQYNQFGNNQPPQFNQFSQYNHLGNQLL